MELKLKQIQQLYCPKCGGELTLDKNKAIGICLHCESAFLLSDEESAILKDQDLENITLHQDHVNIVSNLCSHYNLWTITPNCLDLSGSMKKSIFHRGKMKKVKQYWEIPEEDDVFLISDTGLKSYSHGFALCTSGFYYIENSLSIKGKMTWQEFKNARIVATEKYLLLIDELHFDLLSPAKDVARILKTIQQNI